MSSISNIVSAVGKVTVFFSTISVGGYVANMGTRPEPVDSRSPFDILFKRGIKY